MKEKQQKYVITGYTAAGQEAYDILIDKKLMFSVGDVVIKNERSEVYCEACQICNCKNLLFYYVQFRQTYNRKSFSCYYIAEKQEVLL